MGSDTFRILLLEDSEVRIDGLRAELNGLDVEIRATKHVDVFLKWSKERHDLVIFDHDLEPEHYLPEPRDGYKGPTGLDAARAYQPERYMLLGALVWSWNPEGARRIADALSWQPGVVVKGYSAETLGMVRRLVQIYTPPGNDAEHRRLEEKNP